jgi:hypothetical protein
MGLVWVVGVFRLQEVLGGRLYRRLMNETSQVRKAQALLICYAVQPFSDRWV